MQMCKSVNQAIYDLVNYTEPVDSILKDFNEHDQLCIMNLIVFDNFDYPCKDLALLKELYEKRRIIKQ